MTDHNRNRSGSYRTVKEPVSTTLVVGGSRFIGAIAPADTVKMAEIFIQEIRESYPGATHHVPAYRVRTDPLREWSSDNGEPAGSAGKPVLNVLSGQNLENVVVVITRYFGGKKLGYGGLVSAYTNSTKAAIEAAEIVEEYPQTNIEAIVGYDDSGTVQSVLESENIEFEADYESVVRFHCRVPLEQERDVKERLQNATRGRVDLS